QGAVDSPSAPRGVRPVGTSAERPALLSERRADTRSNRTGRPQVDSGGPRGIRQFAQRGAPPAPLLRGRGRAALPSTAARGAVLLRRRGGGFSVLSQPAEPLQAPGVGARGAGAYTSAGGGGVCRRGR